MSKSTRRWALTAALILSTGLAVAVVTGTGAIPLSQQDNLTDEGDVVVEAGQNQLVDAAAVENGELSINLDASEVSAEGLSPGSRVDNVLQVRNKGNESVDVFIKDSPDNIEFVDENGGAFESNETAVSLGPNESVGVGLKLLDTASPGTEIDGSFTIAGFPIENTETESVGSDTTGSVGSDTTSSSDGDPVAAVSDVEDDSFDGQSVLVDLDPESADAAARVDNLEAGEDASVDLQEAVATSQVNYNNLSVAVEDDAGTVELQADAIPEPPEDEAAELTGDNTAISYLEIESSASDLQLNDESISEARIEFAVSESVFQSRSINRDDPQLYRFNEVDDEWVPLRTERVDTRSYQAFTPNFSVFAVGYPVQPEFQIVETTLVNPEVEADQPVAVAVEVANNGTSPGEFQATLDAGQSSTVSYSVSISPNSTERVVLVQSLSALGSYDVEVNGQPVGPVTVSETVTESPTPTPTPPPTDAGETQTPETTTQTPTPTDDTPGFGLVLTLVALISAGLLARRRARNR